MQDASNEALALDAWQATSLRTREEGGLITNKQLHMHWPICRWILVYVWLAKQSANPQPGLPHDMLHFEIQQKGLNKYKDQR